MVTMTADHPDAPFDGDAPLDPVTEEALARLVHLHSGEAVLEDRLRYEAWKAEGPAQAQAAERAERLWTMLGPTLARSKAKRKSTKLVPVLVAAALGLSGAFAGGLFGPPAAYFADVSTGIGDRGRIMLADGSRVEMDTQTSIDIADGGRRIILHAGQIYVSVAHDPDRPFRVESGTGIVEALGTAFDVRRDDQQTTVVVTDSAVRVAIPESGSGDHATTVVAGQEAAYGPRTGLAQASKADLTERTAWRQGQLRFSNKPLGAVLDELGRYRRSAVLFTDDALSRLPVTGIFNVDDPDALLDAISVALPVKVRRLPWLTIVQRDPARPLDGRGGKS